MTNLTKTSTLILNLQILSATKSKSLKLENFSFSPKVIVGSFLQPAPPPYATEGGYIRMTDVEVASRLEELKIFTRHTALGVEQRIEIARQQQALREAKKVAKDEQSKSKEKVRPVKYSFKVNEASLTNNTFLSETDAERNREN